MSFAIDNPIKVFNWFMDINGVQQFAMEEVKLPVMTITQDPHFSGIGGEITTPGSHAYSEGMIKALQPLNSTDSFWQNQMFLAANPITGGTGLSEIYSSIITFRHMAPNMLQTIAIYQLTKVWIFSIENSTFSRAQSGNAFKNIKFRAESCILL